MIFTKQFLGILILFFHINCYFHPVSQYIVDSLKKDVDPMNSFLKLLVVTQGLNANTIKISLQPILSETYSVGNLIMGIAYDKINDNLFYVINKNGSDEIKRLNISTGVSTSVYNYNSASDSGIRYINENLYLIRTYDNKISKLENLNQTPISFITDYSLAQPYITDLCIISNNIYIIAGYSNFGGFKGVQYLPSPDFNSILTLFTSSGGGWDYPLQPINRSIIAVGSNVQKMVISTGYFGSIELRALDGTLIRSETYVQQGNYLEKDSKNRIYSVVFPSRLLRWDENLQNKETFEFVNVTLNSGSYGNIFSLREIGSSTEIILVNYRSNSPIFYKGVIPN